MRARVSRPPLWGAHAPRELALAPPPARTFSSARGSRGQPRAAQVRFGEAPKPACEARALPGANSGLSAPTEVVSRERHSGDPKPCAETRFEAVVVGRVGLEPTTNALKGRCSTIELPTRSVSSHPKAVAQSQPTPKAFGAARQGAANPGGSLSLYDDSFAGARSRSKSWSELRGRSRRKTCRPAAAAAVQSRSGSSPTCRTSPGARPLTSSARR